MVELQQFIRIFFSLLILFIIQPVLNAEEERISWENSPQLHIAILNFNNLIDSENVDMEKIRLEFQRNFPGQERVNLFLAEQNIQLQSINNHERIKKIGINLGADKIVIGTLSKSNETYILEVKGIDSGTGTLEIYNQLIAYSVPSIIANVPRLSERFIQKTEDEEFIDTLFVEKDTPISYELHADYIEQISEMLKKRLYRDSKNILEIQNIAGYLGVDDRTLLYLKYKLENAWLYSIANIALLGAGSWFQGDIAHGIIITSSYVFAAFLAGYGSAVSMMSSSSPSPQMYIIIGSVLTYAVLRPFFFEMENNKKLKNSLLYQ